MKEVIGFEKKKEVAVFLDRDGVITRARIHNGKSYAPRKLNEFRILPGAKDSINKLKEVGFKVIIATNQPDIGNGLVKKEEIEKMHHKLQQKTNPDAIYCCPHSQDKNCDCRKPKIGMFLDAAKKFNIDLSRSFMVGDRSSDIEAGFRAGCTAIFINRHYAEDQPVKQIITVTSLKKAVYYILKSLNNSNVFSP